MKFRSVAPLAVLVAVVGVVAVVLIQPWGGGDQFAQPAAGQEQLYYVCNVSVPVPPDVHANTILLPDGKDTLLLVAQTYQPDGSLGSSVSIEAWTGRVLVEKYVSAADEGKLKVMIQRLRVGPPDQSTPGWPRTEARLNQQLDNEEERTGDKFHYRLPDNNSGVFVSTITRGAGDKSLEIRTCNHSKVLIDGTTGEIIKTDEKGKEISHIVSEDQATIARFLGECQECKK